MSMITPFLVLAFGLVLSTPSLSESRGLTVELRSSPNVTAPIAGSVKLYDNSFALVIGNDAYTNGWPRLRNAVADANDVATALKLAGFEVTLKRDVDSETLRTTLRQFYAIRGADPEARLLLWYSGHGYSVGGEGFLVPVDAPLPSDPEFKVFALQMRDFGPLMRLAAAKHALAIFDSCFSGSIFTTRAGVVPTAITQATTRPVRQFISSGDADQQVGDDGSFRRLFLQALAGETHADYNGDGYLTGTELGLFISDILTNYSEGAQTPRYGKLRDPVYDQGDFVFALPGSDSRTNWRSEAASSGNSAETNAEIALWTSVVGSQNPTVVQTYLDIYPKGRFAKAAKARIEELAYAVSTIETPAAPQLDQATLGSMIESYLLANPSILEKMSTALTTEREAQTTEQNRKAIASIHDQIFNDADQVVIGNPKGDVTLVEMFDYNCTYCRGALPDLAKLIANDPNLRVVLKEFPILSQDSVDAARVAAAARRAGVDYWAFHTALFSSRGQVTGDTALAEAASLGLDVDKLNADAKSDAVNEIIRKSYDIAQTLNVNGTPTYIIGDEVVSGAVGPRRPQVAYRQHAGLRRNRVHELMSIFKMSNDSTKLDFAFQMLLSPSEGT